MKKKLLSLVLAGAMVASTSVSASAATTMDNVIEGSDNTEPTTNVTIKGQVLDNTGNAPAGTFNVTVPTAASFTVNTDSTVTTAKIKVANNGEQNIDVYATKFVDISKDEGDGITVVKESEVKSKSRKFVSLQLTGNLDTAYLKTEDTESGNLTGIYSDRALSASSQDGIKLANVQSNSEYSLTLSGKGGEDTEEISDAISNDFTLTLKIKKSEK